MCFYMLHGRKNIWRISCWKMLQGAWLRQSDNWEASSWSPTMLKPYLSDKACINYCYLYIGYDWVFWPFYCIFLWFARCISSPLEYWHCPPFHQPIGVWRCAPKSAQICFSVKNEWRHGLLQQGLQLQNSWNRQTFRFNVEVQPCQ